MESNEPAYVLATSGTTAKPKLAVHCHGGYQVGIHSTGKWCFGLRSTDVWWATADIGWAVGHSYIVYAPLIAGCTTIAYEGALDLSAGQTRTGGLASRNSASTGIFTSPTAVRMLMRYGERHAWRRGPSTARARRLRRRGAQPACVGLAAEHGARWTGAGHRSHVADGNRRTGLRQPVRHRDAADQARIGGPALARHRRRRGLIWTDSAARPTRKASWC